MRFGGRDAPEHELEVVERQPDLRRADGVEAVVALGPAREFEEDREGDERRGEAEQARLVGVRLQVVERDEDSFLAPRP